MLLPMHVAILAKGSEKTYASQLIARGTRKDSDAQNSNSSRRHDYDTIASVTNCHNNNYYCDYYCGCRP